MDNGTESRLVQANNGRLAGGVIDGHNVKAQRALFDVALAKEVMRGANKGFVFSLGDAQFDKREGISVEADEVELAFGMLRHMVSGNEDIAEAPQVPVSIRFPTHAFHCTGANPIRPSISLLGYFMSTNLSRINTNPVVGRIFCGHGIYRSLT